jgi:hypothetical protein
VKNVSADLPLTRITVEVECYDSDNKPVAINTKDGSNIFRAVYTKRLNPGKTTQAREWTCKDRNEDEAFQHMVVRVVEYQIDGDWVKTIRKKLQPKFAYRP